MRQSVKPAIAMWIRAFWANRAEGPKTRISAAAMAGETIAPTH